MRGKAADGRRATPDMSLADRLTLHSQPAQSGCIVWTGSRHDDMGYCRMGVSGRRTKYVHVVAWELVNGPVQHGMVLRHTCDNPPCINTEHLTLGTQKDNVADMFARGRASARAGEASNSAKLTWAMVRRLRADRAQGVPVKKLVTTYGISKSQVRNIVAGDHWKEEESA